MFKLNSSLPRFHADLRSLPLTMFNFDKLGQLVKEKAELVSAIDYAGGNKFEQQFDTSLVSRSSPLPQSEILGMIVKCDFNFPKEQS